MDVYRELIETLRRMGYPDEFGAVLAAQLKTDRAMRRMLGYLRQAKPMGPEQIADELVAILEDRERWVRKKTAEFANMRYNAYLNRSRAEDDE